MGAVERVEKSDGRFHSDDKGDSPEEGQHGDWKNGVTHESLALAMLWPSSALRDTEATASCSVETRGS